jgi:hypothetical protein
LLCLMLEDRAASSCSKASVVDLPFSVS